MLRSMMRAGRLHERVPLSGTSGIFVDISACPPTGSANLHITASWDCRQVGALKLSRSS